MTKNKHLPLIFIIITLGATWLFQFMPLVLNMNIEDTSISSFDFASIFFVIGGMTPSVMGVIFLCF